MTGNWNNDQANYRCQFRAEYALATYVDHPKTVYLREADAIGFRAGGTAAAVPFGLTLAGVITAVVASVLSGLSLAQLKGFFVPTNAAIGLSLAVAGWPIATYRPGNQVGWLLLGGGCSYASTAAGIPLLRCVANAGWHGPLWRVVATVTNGGWTWALTLFIPLTLLLFPDGGLLSRRWRWLFGVIMVNALAFAALGVGAGESASAGVPGYLTASERVAGQLSWVSPLTTVATLVTYVSVAVCIVLRFRRGADRVRRQLLWVMLALLLVAVLACVSPLLPDTDLTIFPLALIPLSILVAIFRYQLLDIRLVFSRSVFYLLLTAAAIGAYLAVVGALGQLLSALVALGPSVVATLLIAVAFNPFRVWLQRRVDRAVYGAAGPGTRYGRGRRPAGRGRHAGRSRPGRRAGGPVPGDVAAVGRDRGARHTAGQLWPGARGAPQHPAAARRGAARQAHRRAA